MADAQTESVAITDVFIEAVLEEPVAWEVANLSLTVRDIVEIARWLAPVAERLAIQAPLSLRVHNHPPYHPDCPERLVAGPLRGACLNDDGSAR